ncbi:MAG: hypothetical protein HC788_09465, partial [Sphingopyxis sp.]|nr:hypothetical protein [Sphingopyxis sp.]
AIMAAAPKLQCGIFDLPEVIAEAARGLSTERIELHSGSFKDSALPEGYDLITLVRILHDHDEPVATALLSKIHAALPDGGRLLIVEPMAQSGHAQRMGDAYFGLYLWAMGSGRPRSATEITTMLQHAGFKAVRAFSTALPLITSALVATNNTQLSKLFDIQECCDNLTSDRVSIPVCWGERPRRMEQFWRLRPSFLPHRAVWKCAKLR